jgi:N2-citryl-N6-acetyl-N6-hydroxylysine synthase
MMNSAELFSLECFVNSLLREWDGATISSDKLIFSNGLTLPLLKDSQTSQYQISKDADLNFKETIKTLTDLYLDANNLDKNKKDVFLPRIFESLENIKLTLNQREKEITELYKQDQIDFIDGEQALYIGHNFHPYPKNRGGFSNEDFFKYSPELGQSFKLAWYLVSPEIIHEEKAINFKNQWQLEIFNTDYLDPSIKQEVTALLDRGYIPMPFHPWQEQHILKLSFIKSYIEDKKLYILPKDREQNKWKATSSLRAIYSEQSPYMIKCSLTLRLTNSIRHLQEVEVVRGMQVHDVFSTEKGKEFLASHPYFNIIFEPAFMAFKDPAGKILKESIIVCRENLFQNEEKKNTVVLATVNQKSPDNKETLAEKLVKKLADQKGLSLKEAGLEWFDSYLNFAVKPLIAAEANYGVYLGAHQQNLILALESDGKVKGSYFRDCQGTGYSSLGHKNFGEECPSLTLENGNILPNDFADTLFSYYLMINSTFSTISALSFNGTVSETELYKKLRSFLEEMRAKGVKDSSCLNYLLDNETIWQKGNFGCCFKDINENTVDNPLSIYNKIKNPISLKSDK